ncbi:ferredoxin [Streptomyces sp. NPDC051776]|uniref:ferredoxin n=1 Tax=Streptomyces sp. NPDC051776 TaxID=3155414 RepID=UPI003430091F
MSSAKPKTLRIDRISCIGSGLCAELLPELIDLDEWGFPIIADRTIPPRLNGPARRAVAACPVLAVHTDEDPC